MTSILRDRPLRPLREYLCANASLKSAERRNGLPVGGIHVAVQVVPWSKNRILK
jgi:hypothetical protein